MRWLVIVAITVRVAAAAALGAGPWTDAPDELAGWDVARFQEMADEPGRHWVDHAVEYPPGSVAVIEAIAQGDVVSTHRLLVTLSLAVDLGVAAALARIGGRRTAVIYLLVGLPLVPMGLLRFDLWAVAAAVGAVAALRSRRAGLFAVLVTAGALIKVWPALLAAAALATGRVRAVVATGMVGALAGIAWLAYGGWSLEPVGQVLSLRGATGWHVESVPGSLVALFGDSEPERQLDAFRIGQLDPRLVLAGRLSTLAVVAALVWRVRRRPRPEGPDRVEGPDRAEGPDRVDAVALVMLGSTAALVLTAPLLSPQFLLWLTPWAALLGAGDRPLGGERRGLIIVVGLATTITGVTLGLFGPPSMHLTAPALLLLLRDLFLAAVIGLSLRAAGRVEPPSGGAEDALGQCRPRPGPAGAQPSIDDMPDIAGGLAR